MCIEIAMVVGDQLTAGVARRASWPQYSQRIRFVEMVIEQLTARGVMDASALYEPPFSNLHAGGPDALFGGKESVIEGIFETLKAVHSELIVAVG